MSDEQPTGFDNFWTTEKTDYALVKLDDSYAIVNLRDHMSVIIEDNETYRYVVQTMIKMGNRIFTISEFWEYRSHPNKT